MRVELRHGMERVFADDEMCRSASSTSHIDAMQHPRLGFRCCDCEGSEARYGCVDHSCGVAARRRGSASLCVVADTSRAGLRGPGTHHGVGVALSRATKLAEAGLVTDDEVVESL